MSTEPTPLYCPVRDCTNDWDEEAGICWRHRQLIPRKMVKRIRDLVARLASAPEASDRYHDELRRDLSRAVDEAAAAAHQWERHHRAGGSP